MVIEIIAGVHGLVEVHSADHLDQKILKEIKFFGLAVKTKVQLISVHLRRALPGSKTIVVLLLLTWLMMERNP